MNELTNPAVEQHLCHEIRSLKQRNCVIKWQVYVNLFSVNVTGVARNFRHGASSCIHRCSAAQPSRPYNQKRDDTNRLCEQLYVHWPQYYYYYYYERI